MSLIGLLLVTHSQPNRALQLNIKMAQSLVALLLVVAGCALLANARFTYVHPLSQFKRPIGQRIHPVGQFGPTLTASPTVINGRLVKKKMICFLNSYYLALYFTSSYTYKSFGGRKE